MRLERDGRWQDTIFQLPLPHISKMLYATNWAFCKLRFEIHLLGTNSDDSDLGPISNLCKFLSCFFKTLDFKEFLCPFEWTVCEIIYYKHSNCRIKSKVHWIFRSPSMDHHQLQWLCFYVFGIESKMFSLYWRVAVLLQDCCFKGNVFVLIIGFCYWHLLNCSEQF